MYQIWSYVLDRLRSCQIYVNQTLHTKSAFIALTKKKYNSDGTTFQSFCSGEQDSRDTWTANPANASFLLCWCPSTHVVQWPLLHLSLLSTLPNSWAGFPTVVKPYSFLVWRRWLLKCGLRKKIRILPLPLPHYPTVILHSERTKKHPLPATQLDLHILRTIISHSLRDSR